VIVYHFCITTKTLIPIGMLLLILAIIIVAILFPEIPFPIPIPIPSPSPIPVPAAGRKRRDGLNVGAPSPILASVGARSRNDARDVRLVQLFLNTWMHDCRRPLLLIDGKMGRLTGGAILAFQREYLPAHADGRIDPNGPTMRALALLALRTVVREARRSETRSYLPSQTQFMPGEDLLALLYRLGRAVH